MSFRYENYGTADLLSVAGTTVEVDETKSKYGRAFYQIAQTASFDIPASTELWIKFDLYHANGRFRICNEANSDNKWNGIALANGSNVEAILWSHTGGGGDTNRGSFLVTINTLQTYLFHMKAGTSDGVLEVWQDGEKVAAYTGNVNSGNAFSNFYMQSDGSGNLFSNVIISDEEIGLEENVFLAGYEYAVNFDTLCLVKNTQVSNYIREHTLAFLYTENGEIVDAFGNDWIEHGDVSITDKDNAVVGEGMIALPSNAYLTVNDVISVNAENWTFDCYMYIETSSSDRGFWGLNDTDARYGIIFGSDGIYISGASGSWQTRTADQTGIRSIKVHYAMVRAGSNFYYFVNGKLTWSTTFSATIREGNIITIGGNDYGYANSLYFDKVRISDVALWTEDFIPPTDYDYETLYLPEGRVVLFTDTFREVKNYEYAKRIAECTKVLLHFDDDDEPFKDDCGNTWVATGNPTIDTTNAKFGKALQLNGSTQYIAMEEPITLGQQDFSIDFFEMRTGDWNYGPIFSLYYNESHFLALNSNLFAGYTSIGSLPSGFNHIAISYSHSDNKLYYFINGKLTSTHNTSIFSDILQYQLWLGRGNWSSGYGYYFGGAIDEFRIIIGTALWTEDFIPPTEPYSLVTDIDVALLSDAARLLKNVVTASTDTYRKISNIQSLQTDSKREVIKITVLTSDAVRSMHNLVTTSSDTARNVEAPNKHIETFNTDTIRDVFNIISTYSAAIRNIEKTFEIYNDELRDVVSFFNISVDTARNVTLTELFSFVPTRKLIRTVATLSDVERKVKKIWRYENYGTADLLTVNGNTVEVDKTKSIWSSAFYHTSRENMFGLPTTKELWIKCDCYNGGSGRLRIYAGSDEITGICTPESHSSDVDKWVNGDDQLTVKTNGAPIGQLQTYLLHWVSDKTDGLFEAWVAGEKVYTYTGNLNDGKDLSVVYLQSDTKDKLFSNVIISNAEIGFEENTLGPNIAPLFDVQRVVLDSAGVVTNYIVRDVVRSTEIAADTFSELIQSQDNSFDTFRDVIQTVEFHCDSARRLLRWIMRVAEKKLPASILTYNAFLYNDTKRMLRQKETVLYDSERLLPMTPQEVIKTFMKSLDNTSLTGTAALDEAVSSCTNFASTQEAIDSMIADINSSQTSTEFLLNYCGIDLNNDDTGAITGSDAGGSETKTAESIVPETGTAEYPSTNEFNIRGLTVTIPEKSTLSTDEQNVIAGLYSWWIEGALRLIEESYGLSFTNGGATVKTINVEFVNDSEDGALAWVTTWWSTSSWIAKQLRLTVNMSYFTNISLENENGASDYSLYLDRVIAHELTHAVMGANIFDGLDLPTFVTEGLAELVHGIDDFREWSIDILVQYPEALRYVLDLTGDLEIPGDFAYAGGFIFFRYLAKQGSTNHTSLLAGR